jgi:hypothetical protein
MTSEHTGEAMDTVQPASIEVTSQEVTVSLLSRAAVVLFFSMGSFLIFSTMPRLELVLVALQLAIALYELRGIWGLRRYGLWSGFSIKASLATFVVASVAPLAAWFWLVTFRPPSAPAIAIAIGMALMSVLCLFYGGLLVVSPQLAFRLDYQMSAESNRASHASRGRGVRRPVAGLFLLAAGCLLVVSLVSLAAEGAFH